MAQVSVLLNVYNEEKYLAQCIESVLNQTLKEFELVVVNDGSTDRTLEIVRHYMGQDRRIVLVNLETNVGRAGAINIALEHARGELIAKLDGDDFFYPNKLRKQVDYLERHRDCFLVASGVDMVDENSRRMLTVKPLKTSKAIADRLLMKNTLFHSTILFRNAGIKYREKFLYAQDYDLYLQILARGERIDALQDVLAGYRVQTASVSFTRMGHQKLLANMAREMYQEAIAGKPGTYDNFDPKDILGIEIENSIDKVILESSVKLNFMIYNFGCVRIFAKKYFHHYGLFNRTAVLYLASFLPAPMIKAMVKYAPTVLLRKLNN